MTKAEIRAAVAAAGMAAWDANGGEGVAALRAMYAAEIAELARIREIAG